MPPKKHTPAPPPLVPTFAPELEARIADLLRRRLGQEGTAEEVAGYRQLLWALATFIGTIIDRERAASLASRLTPDESCPALPSTPGSPPKAMTGKPPPSNHSSIGP
ncbi:MAG TPA: hypothetical protein VHX14_11925 [Thermoanaerobaculia bacterium]|nr:hypothetical protein [Thermoanaerobaculia bacterium]